MSEGVDDHLRFVLAYTRELGADHETTLLARYNLANERVKAGDMLGALTEVEIVIQRAEAVLGAGHRVTLVASVLRAHLFGVYGDRAQAVAALERLVPDVRHAYGPVDPVTLSARLALARNRDWADLEEAAAKAYRGLVDDFSAVYGEQHASTVAVVAEAASWLDRGADAAELFHDMALMFEADELGIDVGELDDEQRGAALDKATDYTGDPASLVETIDDRLDEIADLTRRFGASDERVFSARYALAFDRESAGDVAAAVAELDSLVADVGADDARAFSYRYAKVLVQAGTLDQSSRRAQLQALLADAQAAIGADHPTTQTIAAALAGNR